MNVRDLMTTAQAARCTPDTNLGAAVEILWKANCGMLPVVDAHEKVISVITERDICIALGTRNCLPGEITVGDVATQPAICCRSADDIRSVLAKMAEAHVRRLPVVNAEGKLEGLLSMDDIVAPIVWKSLARGDGSTSADDISTLKNPLRPDSVERQPARGRAGTSRSS
jgi:CBS domain-containing protein